eukprot:SAG11_NODE_5374_length_1580_cov_0.997974_1_plen_59_part_00
MLTQHLTLPCGAAQDVEAEILSNVVNRQKMLGGMAAETLPVQTRQIVSGHNFSLSLSK